MNTVQPHKLHYIGKYQIIGELGRGAMGVVYRGFDPDIGRYVAIKTLHAHILNTPEGKECLLRFHNEVKITGCFNHSGIVSIYEFLVDQDIPYFVMEYVEGKELKKVLLSGKKFKWQEALVVITNLLDILIYVHKKGVIHRDIKPANIFLMEEGGVKLTDFGIAHTEYSDLTQLGSILGTPNYMSPEQCLGSLVGYGSDLFSVAVVLYEMMTGMKPFTANETELIMQRVVMLSPKSFDYYLVHLPRGLEKVLFKALDKNFEKRFSSAADFKAHLDHFLVKKPLFKKPFLSLFLVTSSFILFFLIFILFLSLFEGRHSLSLFSRLDEPVENYIKQQVGSTFTNTQAISSPSHYSQAQHSYREKVKRLLKVAEAHFQMERLLSPPGSNAYDAYQLVLEIEPNNKAASEGLVKVQQFYINKVEFLIDQGEIEEAKAHIEIALKFFPRNEKIQALSKQLSQSH